MRDNSPAVALILGRNLTTVALPNFSVTKPPVFDTGFRLFLLK